MTEGLFCGQRLYILLLEGRRVISLGSNLLNPFRSLSFWWIGCFCWDGWPWNLTCGCLRRGQNYALWLVTAPAPAILTWVLQSQEGGGPHICPASGHIAWSCHALGVESGSRATFLHTKSHLSHAALWQRPKTIFRLFSKREGLRSKHSSGRQRKYGGIKPTWFLNFILANTFVSIEVLTRAFNSSLAWLIEAFNRYPFFINV